MDVVLVLFPVSLTIAAEICNRASAVVHRRSDARRRSEIPIVFDLVVV